MFWCQADPQAIAVADSIQTNFRDRAAHFFQLSPEEMLDTVVSGAISFGAKVLFALLIFYVGRWLIKRIRKVMTKIMDRREVDVTLQSFLNSLVSITLMLILITIVIGVLGVNTTSFIALFASAGVAIGLALSGTLQNFAGGVMILLFRPFRIGDYIETQDQSGTVRSIQLFHTVLNTPDNKTILLPNGPISTGIVNNFSRETTRRIEWTFSIAYGSDYDKAKASIFQLLQQDGRILDDPAPFAAVTAMSDSAVDIMVRAWAKSEDYWPIYFSINEKVYKNFVDIKINVPVRQMAIRLQKDGDEETQS